MNKESNKWTQPFAYQWHRGETIHLKLNKHNKRALSRLKNEHTRKTKITDSINLFQSAPNVNRRTQHQNTYYPALTTLSTISTVHATPQSDQELKEIQTLDLVKETRDKK